MQSTIKFYATGIFNKNVEKKKHLLNENVRDLFKKYPNFSNKNFIFISTSKIKLVLYKILLSKLHTLLSSALSVLKPSLKYFFWNTVEFHPRIFHITFLDSSLCLFKNIFILENNQKSHSDICGEQSTAESLIHCILLKKFE